MMLDILCCIFGIRERFGLKPNLIAKKDFKVCLWIWAAYSLLLGFLMGVNGWEMIKISTNMINASSMQIWLITLYEAVSVFGFIFVIGFIGAWIVYQNEVWEMNRAS